MKRVTPPKAYISDAIQRGSFIILNAINSFDSDYDPLTFHWELSTGEVFNGAEIAYKMTEPSFRATVYVSDGKSTTSASKEYEISQLDAYSRNYDLELLTASKSIGAQSCINCHGWFGKQDVSEKSAEYLQDIEQTIYQVGPDRFLQRKVGALPHKGGKLYDEEAENFRNLIHLMLAEQSMLVNQAPIPNIEFEPIAANVVRFDASLSIDSDSDELSYHWDFGDGQQDDGQVVEHQFAKKGRYVVKLTVSDGEIYKDIHQLIVIE